MLSGSCMWQHRQGALGQEARGVPHERGARGTGTLGASMRSHQVGEGADCQSLVKSCWVSSDSPALQVRVGRADSSSQRKRSGRGKQGLAVGSLCL